MFGSDAIMQITHELETLRHTANELNAENTALQARIHTLEMENVQLKLHYLQHQIPITAAA